MQHFECFGVVGSWVSLFVAMWGALYLYGRNAAHITARQLTGRLIGGIGVLIGAVAFFAVFTIEAIANGCPHAWYHVVGSLAATTLVAALLMLITDRRQLRPRS